MPFLSDGDGVEYEPSQGFLPPQVIRQIIWKIMSFFGTFFKVKNLLIGDDLEKTLGVVTNMYYALYKYSLNSPESLRAGRKFIL